MGIINKRNVSQIIVDYILNQIQSRNLKKGDKLMTEHEFAELLGVSRIPLREALCALRTVGLLEARQGGGTYVTSRCDPSILGRMMYQYAVIENVDPIQVINVRMILEPEGAAQAALQATQEQKDEIRQYAQAYQKVVDDYHGTDHENDTITQLDASLHNAIAKASHNEFLWMLHKVVETSYAEMNSLSNSPRNDRGTADRQMFARSHIEIANAIMNANSAAARKNMEKHLLQIKSSYMLDSSNTRM